MSTSSPSRWRYNIIFGVLILSLPALCLRQAMLVRDRGPIADAAARRQRRMIIPLSARLGNIYARAGRQNIALAASRESPSCFVDPFLLDDEQIGTVAVELGGALGMNPLDVQSAILARRESRFIRLKRDISPHEAAAVKALELPAVGIIYEKQRVYPNGSLGATVIGFRLVDGRPGGGAELSCQKYLAATDGQREVLTDVRRRPIWQVQENSRPPVDGNDVYLTLDAVIQGYLEQAVADSVNKFDAKWGAGIVVNPNTGEILAMCSVPTFNPNAFGQATDKARTNAVLTWPYEPGSVFKPIIAAAAVDEGVVTWQTKIDCEMGRWHPSNPRIGTITDHGHRYGMLTLEDVNVHSSNIGMGKVGLMLGNKNLHGILERFGFGQKTGVQLPGEGVGIVRPLNSWNSYSTPRVPFGQEVSATTIQLAMAFSSLVNGGLFLRPRIVDHVTDPSGKVIWRSQTEVVRRVLKPETSLQTIAVLQQVVERGTGKACKMKQWTSFGKTGTAQIAKSRDDIEEAAAGSFISGTPVDSRGGYVDGAFTGSFVGGAPASKPAVVCLISIYWPDESKGHFGSQVAAPYVKDVLEQTLSYLNIPSDKE